MSDIKIPKDIVDKIFKRLDRFINRRKVELNNKGTMILYNKPATYQPYTVDVFSSNRFIIYRSNKPRVLPGNYTNVLLEAKDVKLFTATFFENYILEYKIINYEIYSKYVKLDLHKLMRIEDCWYNGEGVVSSVTDGNYKEYIENSLNSLFTINKAGKDLVVKVVPEINMATFILELLNNESGTNFSSTINKYFNINIAKERYINKIGD